MKTLLRFSLSAAFFCLIAFGCDCEKCPEKRLEYGYPEAEYHKAGSILMYTPGAELFDGVLHPAAGLYEKYFDIDKAAAEHKNYISMLEKQGCTVHTVTEILFQMSHDRLSALAEASIPYDVSNLPEEERAAQAAYKREVLASMSNSDLVRVLFNRPTVILSRSDINTHGLVDPLLMNDASSNATPPAKISMLPCATKTIVQSPARPKIKTRPPYNRTPRHRTRSCAAPPPDNGASRIRCRPDNRLSPREPSARSSPERSADRRRVRRHERHTPESDRPASR